METSSNNSEKNKLNFKDSKYSTGKRKTSIAKVWLKKGSGKIMLMEKILKPISKEPLIKCKLLDHLKLSINQQNMMLDQQ